MYLPAKNENTSPGVIEALVGGKIWNQ